MRIQITTPANTPIASPLSTVVQYMQGLVITHEEIKIPDGHAYLTGIQMYASKGVSPEIPEPGSNTVWLVDNNRVIVKNIRIRLEAPLYAIEFRTYNTDSVWPHSFYIDLE